MKDSSPHLICSDDEADILSDIATPLDPVILAAETLYSHNTIFLTVEGIFKFLMNRLKQRFLTFCIAIKNAI